MSYKTRQNYLSHPDTPPERPRLTFLTRDAEMVYRNRTIETDNTGAVTDSGWSAWSTNVGVTSCISTNIASRAGSSWIKTESLIETAAGIGRPWKLLWRMKTTNATTGAVTYSSTEEKLFLPGNSHSVMIDAPEGSYLQLGSGAILTIADDT